MSAVVLFGYDPSTGRTYPVQVTSDGKLVIDVGTIVVSGDVSVVNTPDVHVTNTPSVTISGIPAVSISGTPAVTISGTPNVNAAITGGTVNVGNTPSVNVANTPSVSISGTPTVNAGPTVTLSDSMSPTPTVLEVGAVMLARDTQGSGDVGRIESRFGRLVVYAFPYSVGTVSRSVAYGEQRGISFSCSPQILQVSVDPATVGAVYLFQKDKSSALATNDTPSVPSVQVTAASPVVYRDFSWLLSYSSGWQVGLSTNPTSFQGAGSIGWFLLAAY